jgi:hypothetical protein
LIYGLFSGADGSSSARRLPICSGSIDPPHAGATLDEGLARA